MKSIPFKLLAGLVAALIVCWFAWIAFKWTVMRVYVPPDMALMVTSKFGDTLPADRITVPPGQESVYKGVWEELLGPGRYFLDPVRYDWELVPQVKISPGNPEQWRWDAHGRLMNADQTAPQVGLISKNQGQTAPEGQEVVGPAFKGIQREVLTPGQYKLNPKLYKVTVVPAVIVPPGSVGVVTDLSPDGNVVNTPVMPAEPVAAEISIGIGATPATQPVLTVAGATDAKAPPQGRIMPEVLQPGIYYINPKLFKVDVQPIGYDVITLEAPQNPVRFISADGYQIEADFTLVWGRKPNDAPHIVANIGDVDRVEKNVIEPAMSSMCRTVGAYYTARQLIEGESRVKFQEDLEKALRAQVQYRNVDVLLALVRNISIKDTRGKDATDGLLQTIQKANIEFERELTNKQKTLTATVQAELEQYLREIDVARQKITSETALKVAKVEAEGLKQAAEIDAERDKAVAAIKFQIAEVEAQRTRAMGQAQADVVRMKNEAEAKGARLLIDAFGTPAAYNQYIFAKAFEPQEIRLIFAGPGTFWTDLKGFQEVGAAKLVQQQTPAAPTPGPRR